MKMDYLNYCCYGEEHQVLLVVGIVNVKVSHVIIPLSYIQ